MHSFRLPDKLEFVYPPSTPTAMYPGPISALAWDVGPSALLPNSPTNAQMLLHVSYLRSVTVALNQMNGCCPKRDGLLSRVTHRLALLERWKMSRWAQIQHATSDPGALRRKCYNTGERTFVELCQLVLKSPNRGFHKTSPRRQSCCRDVHIPGCCTQPTLPSDRTRLPFCHPNNEAHHTVFCAHDYPGPRHFYESGKVGEGHPH